MAELPIRSPVASAGGHRKEAPPEIYDRQFAEDEQSNTHYRRSIYSALYGRVCRRLSALPHQRILEVGCGTGEFARCVMDTLSVGYTGFDFASFAIQRARERTGHGNCFFVGDARWAESYDRP